MLKSRRQPCGGGGLISRATTPHRLVPRIELSRVPGQGKQLCTIWYNNVYSERIVSYIIQTPSEACCCRACGCTLVFLADTGVPICLGTSLQSLRSKIYATTTILSYFLHNIYKMLWKFIFGHLRFANY
jgi:hypothetical protein